MGIVRRGLVVGRRPRGAVRALGVVVEEGAPLVLLVVGVLQEAGVDVVVVVGAVEVEEEVEEAVVVVEVNDGGVGREL